MSIISDKSGKDYIYNTNIYMCSDFKMFNVYWKVSKNNVIKKLIEFGVDALFQKKFF